ncbi:Glycoside hydrolase family 18 catalytic domain [Trinorchestia longiramus]|nr:Glycoside hydrolase family 18 catalytic domain [Trinorchestia longiramus]
MESIRCVLIGIVLVLQCCSSYGQGSSVLSCFFESWSVYRPGLGKFNITDLDPNLCTHIVFCYVGLDPSTHKIMDLDSFYVENGAFERLVGLKNRNPSLLVTVAVGGWVEGSPKYSRMAASADGRNAFADSAVKYLKKHKLDGLDIAWQDPAARGGSPEDKENFVLLCQTLKAAFESDRFLLSVAVSASKHTIDNGYDLAKLSPVVDLLYLITYDYHGKWDGATGAPAPLYPRTSEEGQEREKNVNFTISYVLSLGVQPSKVVLALPFFGRSFYLRDTSSTGVGAPSLQDGYRGPYSQEDGFLGYNEICELLTQEGIRWTIRRHREHQVPYVYRDNVWIAYDDAQSLAAKMELARSRALGGVFVWAVDTDDFRGRCGGGKFPLLTQVNEEMTKLTRSSIPPGGSKPPVVTCFFASWSVYRNSLGKFGVDLIDPTLCTHVVLCFLGLDESNLTITDLDQEFVSGDAYKQLHQLKATNPDLVLSIAIGGWSERSEKFSSMAASPSTRKAFIESVIAYLKQHGFDGVDMVWQDPTVRGGHPEDRRNYVVLLQEMAEAFSPHGYHLGASVSAVEQVLTNAYDLEGIAAAVDLVHLIAYNYHGSWGAETGHTAPLYPRAGETGVERTKNVDFTIQRVLGRGVPPSKLAVMLPFFSRTFLLRDPSSTRVGAPAFTVGFKGPYTKESGWMGYNELCEMYRDEGPLWTVQYQAQQRVPYMYNEGMWVGFDNATTIEERVRLAQSYGVNAIGMWTVDTDDFSGVCGQGKYPLLKAVNRALNRKVRSAVSRPPTPAVTVRPETPSVQTHTSGTRCSIAPARDVTIDVIACGGRQDLSCGENHTVLPSSVVLAQCWDTVQFVMRCHSDGLWRSYEETETSDALKMAVLCQPYYLNSESKFCVHLNSENEFCVHLNSENEFCVHLNSENEFCVHLNSENEFCVHLNSDICGRRPRYQSTGTLLNLDQFFKAQNRWPWVAGLLRDSVYVCSATVINPVYLLTAAHCVTRTQETSTQAMDVRDLKVQLGRSLVRRVIEIRLHPDYQAGSSPVNDIAIIQLEFPLKFHSKLYPACVATADLDPSVDAVTFNRSYGTKKYEYDMHLQRITPSCIVEDDPCMLDILLTPAQFCAVGLEDTTDSLSGGSSGGPLLQNLVTEDVIEAWTVTGVTSYVFEAGGCTTPRTVFTAVNTFTQWILDSVQELLLILDNISELSAVVRK